MTTRNLGIVIGALVIALAGTFGYIIGTRSTTDQQIAVAQTLSAAQNLPATSGVRFYLAEDTDKSKTPTRGDMASFFISPDAVLSGPWVINLSCWDNTDKTATFLTTSDPASLNQPFYRLESSTWPKNAPAYCEYAGTQDGVVFGSGSFFTY